MILTPTSVIAVTDPEELVNRVHVIESVIRVPETRVQHWMVVRVVDLV